MNLNDVLSRRHFLPLLAAPVIVAIPMVKMLSDADAKDAHYSVVDLGVLNGAMLPGSSIPRTARTPCSGRVRSGYGLGTLGGVTSVAYGLNDQGWVVGSSGMKLEDREVLRAVLWKESELFDLGTLNGSDRSVANDINLVGEVVGFGGIAEPRDPNDAQQAILWEADDTRVLLNDVVENDDWNLLTAFAINDEGQIAGLGLKDGNHCGFLLKKKQRTRQNATKDQGTHRSMRPPFPFTMFVSSLAQPGTRAGRCPRLAGVGARVPDKRRSNGRIAPALAVRRPQSRRHQSGDYGRPSAR